MELKQFLQIPKTVSFCIPCMKLVFAVVGLVLGTSGARQVLHHPRAF